MILGIVAEYNPFHNGHQYQIQQAKRRSGADCVVAIMSGNFVQRGDAAICNKWARAEMALKNGVDLVLELPVYYAVQSAEFFAKGAIESLNALGVDIVSFGAECDDVSRLEETAKFIQDNTLSFQLDLKKELDKGVSFPSAREKALGEYGEILKSPNNILAIEYIKAGAKNPLPIKRIGAGHHEQGAINQFASASFIRQLMIKGEEEKIKALMPPSAFAIYQREQEEGRAPITLKELEKTIIANLRKEKAEYLNQICDVTEGLENRIITLAQEHSNLGVLIDAVKTKRYTHSRIRRIMINYLLGITKEIQGASPSYLRLLGGNEKGLSILNQAKLPVITKVAGANYELLKYDLLSTDLYSLLYENEIHAKGGQDYLNSPIIMK